MIGFVAKVLIHTIHRMRFETGRIYTSQAAKAKLDALGMRQEEVLEAHSSGRWSDEEPQQERNRFAATHGHMILARVRLKDGSDLLLASDPDRRATRITLPEERKEIRVGVAEGYALWASKYDDSPNPLIALEEPHMRAICKTLQPGRALDVGTGTGRNAFWLADKGGA